MLILEQHTWIYTYNYLYYHIDIIFSQLRKCPFFIQLVIALRHCHTHENSLYTRD